MTQPLHEFTTGDLCSGRWPTPSDYRRAMWEALRQPLPATPQVRQYRGVDMSGPPAWHHRPGEFCTHPHREWHPGNGPVDKGPWPDGIGPLAEMPRTEGHWVCPGHDTGQGLGSTPGA